MNRTYTRTSVAQTVLEVTGVSLLFAAGCAGTYPAPTQQLADVQAASRSANELGALNNPQAQLYLKLADDQLREAKLAVANDDNMSADRLLKRAKVDAELALALTRDGTAKTEASAAIVTSNENRSDNLTAGATP